MAKITVLLSVHNGAEYLEAAIKSVLAQTLRDYEFLIIDDGSTDRTPEIIDSFLESRVRCIRHENNWGLIASLNEGLAKAQGKYVARMDADDICDPRRLELQVRLLDDKPAVGVVGSAVRLMDNKGRRGAVYLFPEHHDVISWALAFLCPLAHPTVMMRREVVVASGGYDASALHAEDYDLWEKLSTVTRLANLPLPLLNLRKHETSVTSRETTRHTKTAIAVSARCMSRRLGYRVREEVSACLMHGGRFDEETVWEAADVLSGLYTTFETDSPSDRDVVRMDAGLRMILLALRVAKGAQRIALIKRAQSLDPWVWLRFLRRGVGRLTGIGEQRLVA
ncbi:MAG: glycosyltransferase family 2 protein [Burkholderiales bacterium]